MDERLTEFEEKAGRHQRTDGATVVYVSNRLPAERCGSQLPRCSHCDEEVPLTINYWEYLELRKKPAITEAAKLTR